MSRQKRQAISKNEEKKWYKDTREQDNQKINPILIVAGIGYIILGAGAIIALAYFANENLQ